MRTDLAEAWIAAVCVVLGSIWAWHSLHCHEEGLKFWCPCLLCISALLSSWHVPLNFICGPWCYRAFIHDFLPSECTSVFEITASFIFSFSIISHVARLINMMTLNNITVMIQVLRSFFAWELAGGVFVSTRDLKQCHTVICRSMSQDSIECHSPPRPMDKRILQDKSIDY